MDYSLIRKNFETRGFATRFFPRKEEAVAFFKQALDMQTIGFGGSVTLTEMGLYEALSENNAVVWHNRVPAFEVRRLANQARVYITSANAVTRSGEIVNIDYTGNRIAMTAFGPEICYIVVGKNKITDSLDEAIHRCRNVAAPKNARRVKAKTPCAVNGEKCYDCNSPGRICGMTMIHHQPPGGMRCEVIFIDEELGY